jgi:glycerol-3-phosphate O-acyltransferase
MAPSRKPPQFINVSRMLETFNLFFRIFAGIFFRRVKLAERDARRIKDVAEKAQVVYLLPSRSRLEYAFHNYRFLKEELPLSRFIPGLSMLPHQTVVNHVRYLYERLRGHWIKPKKPVEQFKRVVGKGHAVALYVREPDTIVQWGERGGHLMPYLETLLAHHAETGREIAFVPLMLIWKMGVPRKRHSLLDKVFGDYQAPGSLRQMLGFLRNSRRVRCNVLEPVFLSEALAQPDLAKLDDHHRADSLRLVLRNRLVLEQQTMHGPPMKRAKTIISEMVRNEDFHAAIEEKGFRWNPRTERRVKRYLTEIAADFRFRYIEFLGLVTSFLTERFYKGIEIDEEGLETMRQAARKGPLILVPCHRSHFDYLAISNIMYNFGLIPPHIVAGNNLTFWPMGAIFRASGAFFIRRSFKGNVLYKLTLERYIWKLLREGYWIEFFIEGGRSRSGKMLPPKYGILNTILEAHVEGYVPEMVFVPMYMGYEKVLEDESLSRQMSGESKQQENLGGLLKSAKMFQAKYGRMHLEIGDPIVLSDELKAEAQSASTLGESPDAFRHFSRHIAHRIEDNINRAAIITPTSIAAMALFTTGGRGFTERSLQERVGFFLDMLTRSAGDRMSSTVRRLLDTRREEVLEAARAHGLEAFGPELYAHEGVKDYLGALGVSFREALTESLHLFAKHKILKLVDFEGDLEIELLPERRLRLDMYKNAALHFILDESMIALVVQKAGAIRETALPREELLAEVLFLSKLWKLEFVYPTAHGFEYNVDAATKGLHDAGIITIGDDGAVSIREGAEEYASWLAGNLANFVESYLFVFRQMKRLSRSVSNVNEAVRALLKTGHADLLEGSIHRSESLSTGNFKNALNWLAADGILLIEPKNVTLIPSQVERLDETQARLERYSS